MPLALRVLRREGFYRRRLVDSLEGRNTYVPSQSTTPFACTLLTLTLWKRILLPNLGMWSPFGFAPVLRDTARLSQRYPPIARYGVFGVSTWPIGCDTLVSCQKAVSCRHGVFQLHFTNKKGFPDAAVQFTANFQNCYVYFSKSNFFQLREILPAFIPGFGQGPGERV